MKCMIFADDQSYLSSNFLPVMKTLIKCSSLDSIVEFSSDSFQIFDDDDTIYP